MILRTERTIKNMNIKKCENGHFYDADKIPLCPHCQKNRDEYPSLNLLRINDDNSKTEMVFKLENNITELLAGRDDNICRLELKSDYTARQQAIFILKNNNWYLRDLRSLNGTYVNGTKLEGSEEILLNDNDVISFANRENYIFLKCSNSNAYPNNKTTF